MLRVLLRPAVGFMNQLNFKFKILTSFSILFFLLVLPSYALFSHYNSLVQERSTFLMFVTWLISIVVLATYFIMAFYYSLLESLERLEEASNKIAHGDMSVQLQSDTEDEIGKALYAFNRMRHELNNTLSSLDRYKMAMDETSIVSKTDLRGIITYANPRFCEISGYSEAELIGKSHSIIRHPDMPHEIFEEMWHTIQSKKIWRGVIKNRRKNGESYIVDATVIPVLDINGTLLEYVAVRHDITELERSKEELAKHKIDYLTGLPNKTKLLEDLDHAHRPVVFYLNIDDFMKLNDFYGNRMGDRVLVHMAKLLAFIAERYQCQVYRVYNDEFLLLCEEKNIHTDSYQTLLREIINDIEESTIDCNAPACISFTVSGGIAAYSLHGSRENLPLYAGIARNMAKRQHKKLMIYKHAMRNEENYAKNINWIKRIKRAIEQNRFIPYYQPIQNNTTGKIVKYEALVRMIDEEGNTISPFFFLEIAKKAKLYSKITQAVIDTTLETFRDRPEYECSINLSTEDIVDQEMRSYIYNKLGSYPYPERIIFEITESEEIKDFEIVNRFIKKIRSYGTQVSIDDFGTGYANFSYILDLDIDYIKIDGSLIKNIDHDTESRIITEAIIAFSKKLGTQTIVEYVHNQAVYDTVMSLGADYSQGYFIGEPQATI
ncbi:MAG: EAL domain-containing protein [Campylobacterales bacterium]|nr:EAL domain-containing protein [Campylobacterales bacterium]